MRRKSKHFADVIVVGGGYSGLTLAAALGTEGFKVVCLERGQSKTDAKKNSGGRTLALSYRTMQVLEKAGVAKTVKPDACPILDIRIADQDSHSFLDFDHRDVGSEPFGWIIENLLFQTALEKRVQQLKKVSYVTNAVVKDVAYGADVATVILEDGRRFEAQLIVGADGRKSFCREAAGVAAYGWGYGQTAIVCTGRHSLPHDNVAVEHFQPGGPFATLPMTGRRSSVVWTEKSDTADALMKMDEGDFAATLQDKVHEYLGEIELIGGRFSHPLTLQHAKTYVARRLALIADAAHGIHPIAGQGLNLGMGDIEALVEELTYASRLGLDLGAQEILKRYEKRRKLDNGNMVLATDLLDRLFSNAVPPVQAARRFGLGLVRHMPRLKKFFMRTAMGVHALTA